MQIWAVFSAEVQKLRHDPFELATRAIQPLLWLLLFGQVMANVRGMTPGNFRYIDYLAAGILAQSVLFSAIFFGISAIWEKDLGILHRMLVSPAPRSTVVLGKAMAAGVRGVIQGIIVYVIATIAGADVSMNPLHILGVLLFIALGSALFSTLSLIIACIVKTRERFMGIGQVMTMPLFFASNAIYPIALMPGWLQNIAHFNPLTYQVDGLRALMISGGTTEYGFIADYGILAGVFAVLVLIAERMYPKLVA
ncbi:MAG: multidrug ABC transporter permease [Alphaproteobacteria bacterium]|nr:MAG: multidrug ABC transporter permease [Alphaproteobacteria bacterium]